MEKYINRIVDAELDLRLENMAYTREDGVKIIPIACLKN